MSKRLSEKEIQRLNENRDELSIALAGRFVDTDESKDFNQGMAAGVLLATELIGNSVLIGKEVENQITSIAQRCMDESKDL
jgi:hypothetical protein